MSKPVVAWRYEVGIKPHKVTAFEDLARGGVVTLRWYVGNGTQRKRRLNALGFTVRGARAALDRAQVARAMAAADEQHLALVQGREKGVPVVVIEPLTIEQGWLRAKHPDTGKWNKDTAHRKDIDRAISRAVLTWGKGFTWDEVDRGALRKLWRRELVRLRNAGHDGYRGAQLLVDLVLAVGAWLRDEQLVAPTAALKWKGMDAEFQADAGEHIPKRPRYTVEEYRKLFAAAWKADERYGLLYDLGAEFRLGQVSPTKRSELDREGGRLRIRGHGKKRGEVIVFTDAQKANVERALTIGYLAGLEAAYVAKEIADYPLFPGGHFHTDAEGHMVSRATYAERDPVDRSAWQTWHRRAEEIAEIPHVKGRGPYGARRSGVDAANELNISRKGMRAWGGWGNDQMPDNVYADREQDSARVEASDVRAKARGLPSSTPPPTSSTPGSDTNELQKPSQNRRITQNGATSEDDAPLHTQTEPPQPHEVSDVGTQ